MTYFLYDNLPGCWTAWTLAVLAISRSDANAYIRAHHRGGKFRGAQTSGEIHANCGAVTEAAAAVLKDRNEAETKG